MALSLYQRAAASISQRTRWYAFVRLLFLVAIAAPGLISLYAFQGWSTEMLLDLILFMIALASNALFYALILLHSHTTYQRTLGGIWIAFDILLVTFLIYANGGIESRNVILYVMPILMAAAIFGRVAIYCAAILSSVLYSTLILCDYFGVIQSVNRYNESLYTNFPYIINTISFFPSVLIVIALAVDFITKLLVAKEREAYESVVAMERAQEIAKLGSWHWDRAKDEITWSDGLTRILETYHASQPLTYSQYIQFVHPDDREVHHAIIMKALRNKKPFTMDYRILMPDGSVKYVHGEGQLIYDRSGDVTQVVGTAQDMTDARHLDDTKSEFVSLASHQLRTPASGVKAYLSLLIDGFAGQLTRKQLDFAKKANAANERQLDIIDGLLSLASIESGKLVLHRTSVNLNDIVRACLPDHRLEARRKKQKFSSHLSRSQVLIEADSNYLRMAVDNLISNALKYTPDRGQITVSTSTSSRSVYFDVTDTGIGITKTNLPALFQKFSRVTNPASKTVDGSGLGLYLAKYIVDQHRGNIIVRSRAGLGTRFRIRLPRAQSSKRVGVRNRRGA